MAAVTADERSRLWRPEVIGPALIAAIALWLAWTIIANTAADTRARIDPRAALAWRPALPAALLALGEQRLLADDAPVEAAEIAGLARRALVEGPLEARGLRLLALSADRDGDVETAERLMELAARRSRRDPLVEAWLFDRRARRGDFDGALGHADALLRSRPYMQERILPTMLALALDAEARNSLVRILAERPPWRAWYLRELARQESDAAVVLGLLAGLRASAAPPSDAELRPYLQFLADRGQFEQAYIAWLTYLPDERRRSIRYVYNGDFEYPLTGLVFDWAIDSVAGASTVVAERPDGGGHSLKVEFSDRRVAYRHVNKLLLLPPGRYRLAGSFRVDGLDNERGLVWRVGCAEGDKQLLAETPPVKGTADWSGFEVAFEVPHAGCRGQWLGLLLPARAALENRIGGTAWFDDLAIERIGE